MSGGPPSDRVERARVRAAYGNGLLIAFIVIWNTIAGGTFDLGVLATLAGAELALLSLAPGIVKIIGGER